MLDKINCFIYKNSTINRKWLMSAEVGERDCKLKGDSYVGRIKIDRNMIYHHCDPL